MSNTSSLCGKPDDDVSRRSWTVKDWYTHVGAWENATGQLCFGSTMAFGAMLTQFHRVHTTIAAGDGGSIEIKRFMVSDLFGLQESPQGPLTHHHHVTRLQAEVSALQQRLTIADQRVDDLESSLNTALARVAVLTEGYVKLSENTDSEYVADMCRIYLSDDSHQAAPQCSAQVRMPARLFPVALPHPPRHTGFLEPDREVPGYTVEQMKEYGAACIAAFAKQSGEQS